MKSDRTILVFQHVPEEHPGIFRDFLAADGIDWHVVELDAGDPIPELRDYDALWVMGGPMDVWQEADFPWLVAEKQAIRKAVEQLAMPYFGVCLGHQLLAAALGADVGIARQSEVGIMSIEKTPAGKASPYYSGLPDQMPCLQWHSAEVKKVPEGYDVLASSEHCAIQSLGKSDKAVFSMQYHQEILSSTVDEWHSIPEYRQALEGALGKGALDRFRQQADDNMIMFNKTARIVYENWKSVAFPV